MSPALVPMEYRPMLLPRQGGLCFAAMHESENGTKPTSHSVRCAVAFGGKADTGGVTAFAGEAQHAGCLSTEQVG
jgi:hypothetical protein